MCAGGGDEFPAVELGDAARDLFVKRLLVSRQPSRLEIPRGEGVVDDLRGIAEDAAPEALCDETGVFRSELDRQAFTLSCPAGAVMREHPTAVPEDISRL